MKGPLLRGAYRDHGVTTGWERILTRGQRYRVTRTFCDRERQRHDTGEEWYFVGSFFSIYDDVLVLYFADEEWNEWELTLRWPEDAAVGDHLKEHFQSVPNQFRPEYFATARCPGCKQLLKRPAHCDSCHEFWDAA